jgi:hypothetical protein
MCAAALKLSEPDDKNKYYARRLFIFMGTETAALVQARESKQNYSSRDSQL